VARLLEEERVTHLQCTPSMASMLLSSPGCREAMGGLRQLLVGGEALPAGLAGELREAVGGSIVNMYGPTETTIWSSTQEVGESGEGETVAIGRPIGNTTFYVLDGGMRPVPVGVKGELWIGGEGVSAGYLGRPELNRERFVSDPYGREGGVLYRTGDLARYRGDGVVEYLGRVDNQVKLRGYRMELGEIESVLSTHPGVRENAVVVRGEGAGEGQLVAYVVGQGSAAPESGELRGYLEERLPRYMVPAVYVEMERLPQTPNGKVDRRALPEPDPGRRHSGRELVAPRSEAEEAIARIWCRLLRLERVGVTDDFFELGGHSLLVVRMLAEVERELGRTARVASVFQGGATVAGLAALLGAGDTAPAGEEVQVVPMQPDGGRPALYYLAPDESNMVALRRFVAALGPTQPVVGLIPPRRNRRFDRDGSIEQLAQPTLAAIRRRQPRGPYYLCGYSLCGLLAYEIAGRLRCEGEDVRCLGLLDTLSPEATRFLDEQQGPLGVRVRDLTRRMRRAGPLGAARILGGIVSRRVQRLAERFGLAQPPPEEFDFVGASVLATKYQVPGHDVRVDLFVSRTQSRAAGSRDLGWAGVHPGPLECHAIPSDHFELLKEPFVNRVLETLDARLHEPRVAPRAAGGETRS
ncbi:MAG TPA: AMP-binding protein, partial [Terriglobales bacterium]|nr:AMP-binding protein [Terriglobales bacterium]